MLRSSVVSVLLTTGNRQTVFTYTIREETKHDRT